MVAAIRPAHASDLDALAEIEASAFSGDRISRRSFRRLIGSPSTAVLAAGTGRLDGYCVVLFRRGSPAARLYSIAARSGRAPAGTGRALLDAAESEARRRGASALRLEVRADNTRAIALYERAGYRGTGRLPAYYEDGAEALRYEKALPAAPRPAGTARP